MFQAPRATSDGFRISKTGAPGGGAAYCFGYLFLKVHKIEKKNGTREGLASLVPLIMSTIQIDISVMFRDILAT